MAELESTARTQMRVHNIGKPVRLTKFAKGKEATTPTTVMATNRREVDDEFSGMYETAGLQSWVVFEPPFSLDKLESLVQNNNALMPCIDAMVKNIDGTGYEIEPKDPDAVSADDTASEAKIKEIREFFDESYPGMSFAEMRKQMRRDREATGMAYLEVMRNPAGQIVFMAPIRSRTMRIGRLGVPMSAPVKLKRNGAEVTIERMIRPRKYAQYMAGRLVYFAEFGCPFQLNKQTGGWAPLGEKIPADLRATEIVFFGNVPDWKSPYYLPRWINQTPSVLTSRQAEEHNLDYFDAGGVPPYLIIVQGGQLAEDAVKAVRQAMNAKGKESHRVQVIEAFANDGSLDKASNVQVKVERFGGDRSNDAMFSNLDKECEAKIRRAFRLPPLMVGINTDANFACYDEQTETLTDHGWITYDQYRPGMKIACYDDQTGKASFAEPEGPMLVYDVSDVDMHHFYNERVDIMVTPKHRMFSRSPYTGRHKVEPVETLVEKSRVHLLSAPVFTDQGQRLESFTPPHVKYVAGPNVRYDRQPKPIDGDVFVHLLGWFVSEGHIHPDMAEIGITQAVDRHWPEIEAIGHVLETAGTPIRTGYAERSQQLIISDKSLTRWLADAVGRYSYEKRLPELVWSLSREQQQSLFDTLMKGDGTFDSREDRNSGAYSTTSPKLADDVQRLALLVGWRATVRTDRPGTYGKRPVYRVLLSQNYWSQIDMRQHTHRVAYTGKVYCFTVPGGLFITRRNGKVAVQGNTAAVAVMLAEAQVYRPERDQFDEIVNTTIMRDMGWEDYVYRSKPISVIEAATKMAGISMALAQPDVDKDHAIQLLGETIGVDFATVDLTNPATMAKHKAKATARGELQKTHNEAAGFDTNSPIAAGTAISNSGTSSSQPPSATGAGEATVAKSEIDFTAIEGLEGLLGCTMAVLAEQGAVG